ncbi:MAG TPA: hypothetical protein VF980_04965 [Thermoanaerobaculia bacterium]
MSVRPLVVLFLVAFPLSLVALPIHALGDRDTIVLASAGRAPLASLDDVSVRFAEVAGHDAYLRVSVIDESGNPIGGGRIVQMLPNETREVHLRDVFAEEALANRRLQIEVLGGDGRVSVTSTARALVPEPNATASKRRIVGPHQPPPLTSDLINGAEASGAIDSETALLYRVYMLHGDGRLPAQFHGDNPPIDVDSLYMSEVRRRFDSLSPATQAIVAPFLVPPAYTDSWTNVKAGSVSVSAIPKPKPCQSPSNQWSFVDAPTVPVRVWYVTLLSADQVFATQIGQLVEKFWSREADLMHTSASTTGLPLSDASDPCGGGDGKLDIYITDLPPRVSGHTIPFQPPCNQATAAYIEVARNAPAGTIIHEVFHAFQLSFAVNGCTNNQDYAWWAEGSAKWAEDYVESALFPGIQSEHPVAPFYMKDPQTPLDEPDPGPIAYHAYSTYLLPFHQYRTTGNADFVRVAWQNCAREPAIEALDHALASAGGLEKVWPEFVKNNWNRDPVDIYTKVDALTDKINPTSLSPTGPSDIDVYEMKYELPHTTAVYYDFDLTKGGNARSVAFWNGVTNALDVRDISNGALGPQYVTDAGNSDDIKGAHVTAIFSKGGKWQKPEDWTSKPFSAYCRDVTDERVDELVIIISNSEFKDRQRKLKPPKKNPILFISHVGCRRWLGEVNWVNGDVSTNAQVTFDRVGVSAGPLAVTYSVTSGGLSWSAGKCGSGSVGLTGADATLVTYNYLPPENPAHGTYTAAGIGPAVGACGGSVKFPWWTIPPPPIAPGIPLARWLHVGGDGTQLSDSFNVTNARWDWQLTSQKQ